MLETAALISTAGDVLYWHAPAQRTTTRLPDSRALWEAMWRARDHLAGVAHTHPGGGLPIPSSIDLTTFEACELGLGARLRWWIATNDALRCYAWTGPGALDYGPTALGDGAPPWLAGLRARSDLSVVTSPTRPGTRAPARDLQVIAGDERGPCVSAPTRPPVEAPDNTNVNP